ncbi:MAG: aldo/keto reductase, partial [Anaerolineae bacterium]
IADDFTVHARAKGVSPVSLAVAWVMAHPAVTAPIIGARNLEQLEGSLGALDIDMTPEWREQISSISITPPPPTDRLETQSGARYAGAKAK